MLFNNAITLTLYLHMINIYSLFHYKTTIAYSMHHLGLFRYIVYDVPCTKNTIEITQINFNFINSLHNFFFIINLQQTLNV